MTRLQVLTPLLSIFILHSTASAYVRLVTTIAGDASPAPLVRTDNTSIQFLLNSNVVAGLRSSASGKSVTVISPLSDPQAAVRAALATWNRVTTANLKFLPLKSTTSVIAAGDNTMVIAVGDSANELSLVGGALAVTLPAYITSDGVFNGANVSKGTVVDTDIIISPAFAFSTDGSTAYDLQAVLTHELGHALGANHTGLMGASMFQQNSGQRFLTADDITFANVAYPLAGGATLGTISGRVTTAGGAPVPYALLTAFDTSAGVTIGGVTGPDGTYSFQAPAGSYRIYAEPLNGALSINIYLSPDQLGLAQGTKFQTTLFSGTLDVAANGTATANIAVAPAASSLATPLMAVSAVNAFPAITFRGGPLTVPSGQSVDLDFYGAGFDGTLKDSNFTVYGQGIVVHAGSVRVDPKSTDNGFTLLRVTLDVAARTNPSLASFVVTSGSSSTSFSGALVIVPPTPTFVSKGVISAGSYLGSPNGDGAVSPGGIYSIYDLPSVPNLGPAAFVQNGPYDDYGNLATLLGGVSVTFDGVPAPMFLSSGGQLNFQVPFEVAEKPSTKVIVNYLGSASTAIKVPVLPVQPGFFTSDGKAVKAYNLPDYTLNTAQIVLDPQGKIIGQPATKGSYVEVYGTGVGKVSYTVQTGLGAPAAPAGFTGNYTYSVGGSTAAPALFGGWTPTAAGLAQWDLQIPANTASGAVSIVVTDASGATSQPGATIFVK